MKISSLFIAVSLVISVAEAGVFDNFLGNRKSAAESAENEKSENYKPPPPPVTIHHTVTETVALPTFTLPSLPSITLPTLHLPTFTMPKRETVTSTRTIYVETTSKVVKHPVCLEVTAVKPPCLTTPYHDDEVHYGNYDHVRLSPTKATNLPNIQPTVAVDFKQATRIATEVRVSESEVIDDSEENSQRTGKYLVPHPHPYPNIKSDDLENQEIQGKQVVQSALHAVENLLPKVTVTRVKTVHITKVEKYLDRRVTATLTPHNCMPVNSNIPYCPAKHPSIQGPPNYPPNHLVHQQYANYIPEQKEEWKGENVNFTDTVLPIVVADKETETA